MIEFIKRLFIGLILLFMFDFIIGSILDHFYFTQDSGFQYRTTLAMNEVTDDILIFGSSRANHHYKPSIIEEEVSKSCYNTGRDAQFIFYQTALLRSILKRYTPKFIIYDFYGSFLNNESDYDRLSSLLPYYNSHKEIRSIVNLRSRFERLKNISKIYPYNSLLVNIAAGNSSMNKTRFEVNKGYVALNEEIEEPLKFRSFDRKYEIDSNKIRVFKEFLKLCKTNNISLQVIVSPVYYKYEHDYSLEITKEICNSEHIMFTDFTKDSYFLSRPDLFADQDHLNDKGATIFTKKIATLFADKKLVLK